MLDLDFLMAGSRIWILRIYAWNHLFRALLMGLGMINKIYVAESYKSIKSTYFNHEGNT
jgi:hypothetical protein